jgi:hypothetical protein
MITRAQMPRQLRDKGGIASVTPRENYGLGSKIKERFRKLIPNELADVAVKAAPFVAPFNPGIAGLMRGIGRFDQRGSISDALKQGAATFGFGAGARALGGADPFGGGLKGGFTSPLSEGRTTAVKNLFKGDPKITPDGTKREGPKLIQKGVDALKEKIPLLKNVKDDVAQKLLVGGLTSGASALYSYFTGEFEPQEPGESLEEYMARRRESVKSQMRQVMDSYYTPLRNPQYAAMSAEEKDKFIDSIVGQGMATGGRVGYQTGGITMANTLAENIARNKAAQASVGQMFQAARDKIAKTKDYAVPVVQGARALLTGAGEPIITDTMRQDLIKRAEAKGGDSGSLGYEDYGLQTSTPGGRFAGGITDIISDPQAFANAATLGRVSFDRDPETGEYSFGDTKYDFTPDPDTGSTGSALLDFINEGGVKAKISDLLTPSTAMAAETMAEKPKEDPTGYNFDSEYYRNNPGSKDFDRFKVAYAKSLGMDDQISVTPEGQVSVNFGSFDPSRTYQAYKQNKQTNYDRPFFYKSSTLSPERTAELEKQENILTSLYGSPGKTSLAKGGMPTGIMKTNKAGVMERDYRDKGGFVPVGIKEKADDVPAMLSKNEFVFTADAVRGAGNGSIEKGAQRMYDTMKNLEKRVT